MTNKIKPAYVTHATFIAAVVAAFISPWLLLPLYVATVIYAYYGDDLEKSGSIGSAWSTGYSVAICCCLFDHVKDYLSHKTPPDANAIAYMLFFVATVLTFEAVFRDLYLAFGAPHVNRQIDKFVRS